MEKGYDSGRCGVKPIARLVRSSVMHFGGMFVMPMKEDAREFEA
jgi:hypothetical protein